MSDTVGERALPLRVPIHDGESLDSWLEALGRRNGLNVPKLLTGLGLPRSDAPHRLVLASPEQLRRLERQAGLPLTRLDSAVLHWYLPRPVAHLARPAHGLRWLAQLNSFRYCPRCLADNDGRWLLAWRLAWSFACTRHQTLLQDNCPGCGKPPRGYGCLTGPVPPATCARYIEATPTGHCGTDLREATPTTLAADDPLLTAQHHIDRLLAECHDPQPRHTSHHNTDNQDGAERLSPPRAAMHDLSTVARWLLIMAGDDDFDDFSLTVQHAWRYHRAQAKAGHRLSPPSTITLAGALAARTVAVITGDEAAAIQRLRAVMAATPVSGRVQPPRMPTRAWTALSAPLRARFLRALDPYLSSVNRIRCRSGTPHATNIYDDSARLAARADRIPQLLWPDWTMRLQPPQGSLNSTFRAAMATCLLLPGNPETDTTRLMATLHAHLRRFTLTGALLTLGTPANESVFAAICELAHHIDEHGSLIDYSRRRRLVTEKVLTYNQWLELCYPTGTHPGDTRQRRHRHAQRYLRQLLTGSDLNNPRESLAFEGPADRSRYVQFVDSFTPELRQALHNHASEWLPTVGIHNEPLTWQPPASCCAHLTLPGRDPHDIDLPALRQLIITQGLPPGMAAEKLGTTIGHVRLAMEHLDRPEPTHNPLSPAAMWERKQRADQLFTREFLDREYLQARKPLRQLATETGFPRTLITQYVQQAGISTVGAHIDPDWLREQYLQRKRSYTDLAAELGVLDVTVIAAARRYGIPSRPKGVHSRPIMITTLGADIPADVRRAVEGTLHGWLRLQRFQTAMHHTTIEAAARHLNAHQASLIHSFHRLEHDIGAQLYHRATYHQPMHPTQRGTALLRALRRPHIHALMTQHAKTPAGRRRAAPDRPSSDKKMTNQ